MDRRVFSLSLLGSAVAALTGCGGGGGGEEVAAAAVPDVPAVVPPAAPTVELASATALKGATVMLQTVAAADGDGEPAPGQANYWDLEPDFSLEDGYNDQWDQALVLSIDDGATVTGFPSDQLYSELTFYGPELGAADGVVTVTFNAAPNRAELHQVRGAALQQTLDLRAATGAISATWNDNYAINSGNFGDEPSSYQVVVRSTAGALLATLYSDDRTTVVGTQGSGTLTAFAGQIVVLSFELSPQGGYNSPTTVTAVSVRDGGAVEYVTNGNFAAGGTGWTVPAVKIVQNVQSGVRTLAGLEVQRMFFSQPNATWGRFTDTFRNPTGAPITVTVTYASNLGSDGYGILYTTPGANGKALTAWDGNTGDRDVAIVYGTGTPTFTSASALNTNDGNDDIFVAYPLTVAAGATVTLVHFIVMNGTDTGQTAADTTARATATDTAAADIATNFRNNVAYRRGMLQPQLDTLANF
ncbi:hypothetical protein [Ramlibacter humi]|uniref:Lipoprotein n=1 Tax=Ramlibacter humi TaxID=2530451 RepID=A0A4Z0C7W2_9BURK|nr:hypothetical protein [Ramlibacter humi]TFZ07766.1 hypothetical protein EZ216_00955 [Ramlibacter humi]